MLKLILAVFALGMVANTAKANITEVMDHKAQKKLVRLSLWYEGTKAYEKSMFRPGAAEKLLENNSQVAENRPAMSEELIVALENLDS